MKEKVLIGLIFASVAAVIFILSYNVIWITDSITYQYSFATGERITGIADIFLSQYAHYFTWNGRYVAHWLCQLFLPILGKGVFAAVNAVMYVALIVLVIGLSGKRPLSVPRVLTAACLVLFFCDTDYAPTCQIGYVWMAALVLGYLCLFFNYAVLDSHSAWSCLWLLPFSIIAGNAQEAINIGVGGALIVHVLTNLRNLTRLQWCMAVGFGIGGLFLCLSPASIGRTDENAIPFLYSIVAFFLNLRVTYVFLVILTYRLLRRQATLRGFYRDNTFFINAMLVLLAFNFLIGVGSNRQLFGIELFACVLSIRLLKARSFPFTVLWVFSLAITGIYAMKFLEIKKAETVYEEVSAKISANPEGPIFIDFPCFNPYIRPTAFFRYGVYLDYALESIAQSQKGSVVNEGIPCYPKKVEEFLKQPKGNQAYEYLPGEYILMQNKEEPEQFILHRSINILGVRIQLPSYQVEFDPDSRLNTDEYNILYLPCILPIIENESVTIE